MVTKQDWIDALESGQYEQGKFALKNNNEFCCLGVLCDLFVKEGIGEWEEDVNTNDDVEFIYEGVTFRGTIPSSIYTKFGLDTSIGDDTDTYVTLLNYLVTMNDVDGRSFKEIAEVIKEKLPDSVEPDSVKEK